MCDHKEKKPRGWKDNRFLNYVPPVYGNYRCDICDSREGPFYKDQSDPLGVSMLCSECHHEILDVTITFQEVDDAEDDKS